MPTVRPLALAIAVLCAPLAARATGAAMFTGPVAIPRDLVSPDEPAEEGMRVFALGSAARSRLDLREVEADLAVNGGQVGFVKRGGENHFLMLSAGLHAEGALEPEGEAELDLRSGLLVQAAASWRIWEGYDGDPFVITTAGLSILRGSTSDGERLDVNDLSLSLAVGRAFAEAFAPYLAVKGFAGPASWRYEGERLRGYDVHRFAAAVGILAAIDAGWDLQVELSPVGARALTLAIGRAW